MTDSSTVQTDPLAELLKRVKRLDRRVAFLVKKFDAYVPPSGDLRRKEWCAKRRISNAQWYVLKKKGETPRTIKINGIETVTPEADRDWVAKYLTDNPEMETAPAE
jgi:hypothetical protein